MKIFKIIKEKFLGDNKKINPGIIPELKEIPKENYLSIKYLKVDYD